MGRTEKGVDRGLEIAVGGIEEELGRCIIHAVGLQVERFDLLVHGCRSGPGEGSHAAWKSGARGGHRVGVGNARTERFVRQFSKLNSQSYEQIVNHVYLLIIFAFLS